jgi:ABC-2 type transport system permease protein
MKWHRVQAIITRHYFLAKRNPARLMDVLYWPFLELAVWGLLTTYLVRMQSQVPPLVTSLLGALILWSLLFRSQHSMTVAFLEEIWSRNLMNLFASPLTPGEFLCASMCWSLLNVTLVSLMLSGAAAWLYAYDVLVLGVWLVPFVVNLVVTGWVLALIAVSLILRFGQHFATVAWGIVLLLQPISCVFYPVEALPAWLQPVAMMNPTAHVFEGMRGVLLDGKPPGLHLRYAMGLNAAVLAMALWWFHGTITVCRERGALVKVGE